MNTVFVTGATGAVGSAVVAELLRQPDTSVVLLIRATDEQHLQSRLEDLWTFWRRLGTSETLRSRVTALSGDVTAPQLGLSTDSYTALSRRCTQIVHSAGAVRMNLPLEEARHHSVGAVAEILALAKASLAHGVFKKLEYLSTVGVGGRDPSPLPEAWISRPWAFHNTYEAAKYEAECKVREAVDQGVPITVHRPSMVVGNTHTGAIIHFQVFYHICEFLSGKRTYGIFPRLHGAIVDTIPANYVAQAVAWSSGQTTTEGQILHLCSGGELALSLDTIRQAVRRLFAAEGRLTTSRSLALPLPVFRASLPLLARVSPPRLRRTIGALPAFLTYLSEAKTFDNRRSLMILEGQGVILPRPQDYLETMIEYYLEQTAKSDCTTR